MKTMTYSFFRLLVISIASLGICGCPLSFGIKTTGKCGTQVGMEGRMSTSLAKPIDLTLPISRDMLVFPGDPLPKISTVKGKPLTVTTLHLNVHIGTHLDAPAHFIEGAKTVDQYPPEKFFGNVFIADLTHCQNKITKKDLLKVNFPKGTSLFVKTRNSTLLRKKKYQPDHVYFDSDAINFLIEQDISLLGFDYYNIDNSQTDTLDNHIALAKKDIPVVVALDLSKVTGGEYNFTALPLPLKNVEGAPVRAIVWKR